MYIWSHGVRNFRPRPTSQDYHRRRYRGTGPGRDDLGGSFSASAAAVWTVLSIAIFGYTFCADLSPRLVLSDASFLL